MNEHLPTSSPAPAAARDTRTSTAAHQDFTGLMRSEWLKVASLTSMRWLALAAVGAEASTTTAVLGSATLSALVIGLLTALGTTSEYATGSIRTTLAVAPRRGLALLAKAAVSALLGVVLSVLGSVAGLAATSAMHPDGWIEAGTVVRAVVAGAIYVAVVAVFCLLLGTVLRGVALTTASVMAFVLLLPAMTGGVRVDDVFLSDYLLSEAGPGLVLQTSFGADAWVQVATVSVWMALASAAAAARLGYSDA
jgi:ABC-2 type transport system permease protein